MNATILVILLCIYTKNKIPSSIPNNIYNNSIKELLKEGLIEPISDTHIVNQLTYRVGFKGIDFLTKLSKSFNSETI